MTRRAVLVLAVAVGGCPRAPDPVVPDGDDTQHAAPLDAGDDTLAPARCGDEGTVFTDGASVPTFATLIATIAVHDDALPDALRRLSAHVTNDGAGLPVPDAFAVRQWTWQVPLVASIFTALGLGVGEMVAVHGSVGMLWLAPLGCTLEDATLHLRDRFDLNDVGTAVIATPRDRDTMAHDVLVLPGAMVLVPPGRAREVLTAWSMPQTIGGPPPLRQRIFALLPATIRVVARPVGLVDPESGTTGADEVALRLEGEHLEVVPGSK